MSRQKDPRVGPRRTNESFFPFYLGESFSATSNACAETCIFITCILVISAFGLPIVLAHTQAIAWGACALVITGNLVMFAAIGVTFFLFTRDDFDYSSW